MRTLTAVQRQGHQQALRITEKRSGGPDCSNCRSSKVEIVGGKFEFVCKVGFAMPAKECPGYKDARMSVLINYYKVIGADY